MTITINGSGTITGASTLATTVASPTLTTPNIDSAQIPTVSGTAPLYMCRAWVNFNGTGTVAIRASGNVSSITDNGTGNYTVNFTTALPDTSYSPQVRAALINYNIAQAGNSAQSVLTTSYNPGTFYINGSNSSYNFNAGDPTDVYIAIFR